jgi:hypothetical protein
MMESPGGRGFILARSNKARLDIPLLAGIQIGSSKSKEEATNRVKVQFPKDKIACSSY